jgi:hypothetical protein
MCFKFWWDKAPGYLEDALWGKIDTPEFVKTLKKQDGKEAHLLWVKQSSKPALSILLNDVHKQQRHRQHSGTQNIHLLDKKTNWKA